MPFLVHHPYWYVRRLVETVDITNLSFSYYRYRPQSLIDERSIFSLTREQFLDVDTMTKVIAQCPPEFELAIHSNVDMLDGGVRHIPMIDMSTSSKAQIYRLDAYLENDLFRYFSWYASGRSFHGYADVLLNHNDWTKLMGALLLSNQKNLAPTVDPRWIGHRLIAGYSALRWTKNTNFYVGTPRDINPI